MIAPLQYITQDHPTQTHTELCEAACQAGINWVQLRMKQQSDDIYLETAHSCRAITQQYGAKLIINDRLDIALAVGADGVHLGQTDLNTAMARTKVPQSFIIGGTANTLAQAKIHLANGVDYMGVGPFKMTQTKKNLSPILGLAGYKSILSELPSSACVIAVGGITLQDVAELKSTGIYGIAVSGLITCAENKKELVASIKQLL